MTVVLGRLQEGLLIVFLLHAAALIFVERGQFEAPSVNPSGKDQSVPQLWRIGAGDLAAGLLWLLLLALTVVKDMVLDPVTGTEAAFEVLALLGLILAVSAIRSTAQPECSRAGLLSRGGLVDGVRELARKSGSFEGPGPSVYVLEDESQGLPCAPLSAAIVVPRQLLDSMSRREIDALAAWQLCRQSKQCHALPLRRLLVWNAVAVCLSECLLATAALRWVASLPLLVLQIAALVKYLPPARLDADLRAARLTGDAEVFLYAVAGLFRSRGVPLTESLLRRIARRIGAPSGRIPEMLAGRVAPPEDRYPPPAPISRQVCFDSKHRQLSDAARQSGIRHYQ